MSADPLRLALAAHAAGLMDAEQLARLTFAAGAGEDLADLLRGLLGATTVAALSTGETLDVGARLGPGSLPTILEDATQCPPDLKDMLALGLTPGVFARRYALGEELGRGGVGVVSVGQDALMGRSVAIKSLLRGGQAVSGQQLARFVAEARTTAQLDHPNIVPVYDFGQRVDGSPCFTMRWVRGRSLGEVLAARGEPLNAEPLGAEPLSDYRLIQILAQVCMAVDYAHSKGVIHRDIKPENIMVGGFGEVLLMDWGVAKARGISLTEVSLEPVVSLGESGAQTLFGGIVGTPGYMPPEQARGGEVDARSDVWSLGAVLYQMLTGRKPVEGSSALAMLMATVQDTIVAPSACTPERHISEDLEAICLRAMAHLPGDRYPSARAMHADLERYLAGTQEAERRQAEAQSLVAAGDESRWYIEMIEGELRSLVAQLQARPASNPESMEIKRVRWALEDRCRELEAERTKAFTQASARYVQATERVPDHPEARARLSDLHWARYREARVAADRVAAAQHLEAVRLYHDTRYIERLSGQVPLTLHTEPEGVEVALYRITERDRIWVPVGRRVLGHTPLVEHPIPTGRQLIELRAPGARPVRLPVMAWEGDALRFGVPLPTDEQLGAAFVYVPGGEYLRGGDPKAVLALPAGQVFVEGFAMARYPVTVAEYLDFLSSLPREEALQRMPRQGAPLFDLPSDGRWPQPLRDRDGDVWDPAWPVCAVSFFDAQAYAQWCSARDGVRYRLPTEDEWEKAARGTDGRRYPWGEHFDPTFCSMRNSEPGNLLPKPIGTYEADCSPYGVRDLSGGVREWVDSWFEENQRVIRGGAFNLYAFLCRAASRWGAGPHSTQASIGFRLVKVLPE